MFFFLVTGLSFIFFMKCLALKPLPSWASEMRFLPIRFWKDLYCTMCSGIKRSHFDSSFGFPLVFSMEQRPPALKHVKVEVWEELSVLDLPELALECILERLSPNGLCNMAGVCSSLRKMCTSDYLWERHMKQKWGGIIGPMAYREWQWFIASRKNLESSEGIKLRGLIKLLCRAWPFSLFSSKAKTPDTQKSDLPVDSIMSWYIALETGRFWFPAQVFNRENGHIGFLLSCYDAELSYDPQTDTFQARYPPHGKRAMAIETGVQWERIRAPPVETSAHHLHISDCLADLCPGDHIEIQWRRNKEFPYGWWYGVVSHLETCDDNQQHCRCLSSDSIVLEFKQYNPESRWRRTIISRKDHREKGNEADGFYGGVRKLCNADEISRWKRLWPPEVLQ
ncbi:hypothetical protein Droror1_Dr00001656 [Drosera rotundifolia]